MSSALRICTKTASVPGPEAGLCPTTSYWQKYASSYSALNKLSHALATNCTVHAHITSGQGWSTVRGLVPVKVDMEDNEHVMIYYLQGKRLWSQLSVSDVRNSTVSFLTDFKWFNRCVDVLYLIRTAEPRLWKCVCQCFVKTLETYTTGSYLHVSENLIWWVKFQSRRAPYQRVSASKPWLIVAHLAGAVSWDPTATASYLDLHDSS